MGISRGNITTNIIKNGLVFNMDAANRASYPKTGTTATDTIGNISSTLNGTIFENINSGVFNFDGVDDDISFAAANSGPLNDIGTGDFTVSVWANAVTKTDYGALIGNNTGNGLLMWRVANSNVFQCYIGGDSFTTTYTIPFDDTWHYYSITRSGTGVTLYVDGISVQTGTSSATLASNSISYIGNQPHNNRRWKGTITNVQIYNKALSDEEVTQNYNALKGRFV